MTATAPAPNPADPREAKLSVAIIVLNYNTANAVVALHRHISDLQRTPELTPYYIIVDNASTASDAATLTAYFSSRTDSELIINGTNSGYAHGNNVGLKRAAALGIRYSLIANSDISILTPNFLEHLIRATKTLPACGLIGPRVVFPNGQPQGPLPITDILNSVFPLPIKECTTAQAVYATVGCFIFGETNVFQSVGFFDEATFLYREEIILAENLRAKELFWYYLPGVTVRHDHIRKVDTLKRIISHRRFERESTVYYFKKYRRRSGASILVYRALFSIKVAALISISFLRSAIRRPSTSERLP